MSGFKTHTNGFDYKEFTSDFNSSLRGEVRCHHLVVVERRALAPVLRGRAHEGDVVVARHAVLLPPVQLHHVLTAHLPQPVHQTQGHEPTHTHTHRPPYNTRTFPPHLHSPELWEPKTFYFFIILPTLAPNLLLGLQGPNIPDPPYVLVSPVDTVLQVGVATPVLLEPGKQLVDCSGLVALLCINHISGGATTQ